MTNKETMTNKEAIELLNRIAPMPRRGDGKSITQSLVMEAIVRAIQALEQIELNPSEDAIGMDAVIEWLKNKDIIKLSSQEEIARKELKELLSVTPRNNFAKTSQDCISRAEVLECAYLLTDDEGITHEVVHADDIRYATPMTWSGWTPATQLPEPSTAVLLHVKYKSSSQWTYQLGMWNDNKQAWEDWRTPYQLEEEFEVIAWMELPEGYEEGNHE